jgi:hypothetical protein
VVVWACAREAVPEGVLRCAPPRHVGSRFGDAGTERHHIEHPSWVVGILDAQHAVEELALEGVGERGVRRAREELQVELEAVVPVERGRVKSGGM